MLASLATLVTLALASSVSAVGCFSGGQAGDCSAAIDGICSQVNGHAFGNGRRSPPALILMESANTGGGGAPMGKQQCVDNMSATNGGCNGHGSIRQDRNFLLTLDPNTSAC
ncbi:hypothetical protein C8J57DRAFT_1642955 [Mycena rebaudengoi]|nr:hypothetical protein C8J57DRAFT_1642955 [Mycena rebaudengoi]